MRFAYLIALLLVLTPRVLAEGLPELGDSSQSTLSTLQERQLGEQIIREIRADPAFLDDPPLTDYLNNLGYRLASSSDEPKVSLELFALRDNSINAFALPGGFIGVHSGLLLATQSESELAAVLAHEIAHVTQHHIARILATQKQSLATSLAGIAIAILAARAGNGQLAQGALIGTQALAVQGQLNFTREHEQEADRIGLQTLDKAGFDVRGMAAFFERLQKSTRFVEGNAPSYLRTHPLTFQRIADVQNRVQHLHYRQVADSQEFQFLRARLRAREEAPKDAIAYFENSLQEKKYTSEAAQRFGLANALLRARNLGRAESELAQLRKITPPSPLIEIFAGELKLASGKTAQAAESYRTALKTYPQYRPLVYAASEVYLQNSQAQDALNLASSQLQIYPGDYHLFLVQAKSYAALDKKLLQHKSLAEAYYLLGNLPLAIEQLRIARASGDGDFYQLSTVEVRLKELRVLEAEQRKEK